MPVTEPLLAVTVQLPALLGAVKRPGRADVPPLAVQANAGWVAIALPNWSRAWAVNCWVHPWRTEDVLGETAMLVNV